MGVFVYVCCVCERRVEWGSGGGPGCGYGIGVVAWFFFFLFFFLKIFFFFWFLDICLGSGWCVCVSGCLDVCMFFL